VNDSPTTASSDVGLRLATGAALRFWFTFILGGSFAGLAINAAHGDCGGPEWGGCFGPFALVFVVVASTVLGVVAALSRGVAVFILRHTYAVMIHSHRVASSALTALAVVVVGSFVLSVGPREEAGWQLLIVVGLLPFLLSILVVPVVSRVRGAQGGDGAV